MKKLIPLLILFCVLTGVAVLNSCKKDPVIPTLTTSDITNITINSATGGGVITSDGGAAVTSRGICWGTSANPTVSDAHTSDDTGTGSFISTLADLSQNTVYYVRAYATNKAGTAYGKQVTFTTTQIVAPTLTTTAVTAITLTTAVTGGNITSDGAGAITARGVCWATTAAPTITNDKTTDGTGVGSFVSNLSSLTPGTVYYIRAYATNSAGTGYGNEISFTTTAKAVPTLTTVSMSAVTQTTAISGGNISFDGGASVTARGICWGTTTAPTIVSGSKTTDGAGTGAYVSNLTSLVPGTTYYVRAYATNSVGTGYGNEISFVSGQVLVATLTTTAVSAITYNSAVSGGNVLTNGGGTVTGRGVCWATTANPTMSNSLTTDGAGTGSFTSTLTGLLPGTVYHVRAYAVNSAGAAYGTDVQFTTVASVLPTVTTTTPSAVATTTATSGGNVTAEGGNPVTAKGVCWGLTANPDITGSKVNSGTGTGVFTSNITGLTAGTIYHIRAYATSTTGTAYGSDMTITTLAAAAPGVTTTAIAGSSITTTAASSGGNVAVAGAGTVTERGICWSISTGPTVTDSKATSGTGTGSFTANLASLTPNTTYYVRAYAINNFGTGYGNEVTFRTFAAMDKENTGYYSVTLGTQTWLTENLKTKTYNDGTAIPTTTTLDISGDVSPKYQWAYNDNENNVAGFGRLYTFFVVTDAKGICPAGYHVPTDTEWNTLHDFLTNSTSPQYAFTQYNDDIAKSMASASGWATDATPGNVGNDQASNNLSGFTALPGGFRKGNSDGTNTFQNLGSSGYWSSSTEGATPGTTVWYRSLGSAFSILGRNDYGSFNGYSVRCVK